MQGFDQKLKYIERQLNMNLSKIAMISMWAAVAIVGLRDPDAGVEIGSFVAWVTFIALLVSN